MDEYVGEYGDDGSKIGGSAIILFVRLLFKGLREETQVAFDSNHRKICIYCAATVLTL